MNQSFKIALDHETFLRDFTRDLVVPGARPVESIERLLSQQLAASLAKSLGDILIKPPLAIIHSMYFKNRWATLPELIATGYDTWHIGIRFSTKPDDTLWTIKIEPEGFRLQDSVQHSFERKPTPWPPYQFKAKPLKTRTNHVLTLWHLSIDPVVFEQALEICREGIPPPQPYLACADPLVGDGRFTGPAMSDFVTFNHIIDGSRTVCSCSENLHKDLLASALTSGARHEPNSVAATTIRLLSDPTYFDGICHLCVARAVGPEAAAARYGDSIEEFLHPYIRQVMQLEGLDRRTARAEVQAVLGISRWIRETELYQRVKELFPERLVMREASPDWLGLQRLDIFVPDLKLAIEYQGEQHFKAVSAFGGEDALARTLDRDALKQRLCAANGVELVYFKFDDALSLLSVRHRLRRFVEQEAASG